MAKTGRPAVDTDAITVRVSREVIEALDAFRKDEADLPTRPEGIRRMLIEALKDKGYLQE
jgi:metal-responsive CopG/Arc/MetJ family transcriptional regulator